jgi:hypothetical protein
MTSRQYEYRGIRFALLPTGIWVFNSFLPSPARRWGYWCRFFDHTDGDGEEAMRRAIDRAHADAPVYRGDIGDQRL